MTDVWNPDPVVPNGYDYPIRIQSEASEVRFPCMKVQREIRTESDLWKARELAKFMPEHIFERESQLAHSTFKLFLCCRRAIVVEWSKSEVVDESQRIEA